MKHWTRIPILVLVLTASLHAAPPGLVRIADFPPPLETPVVPQSHDLAGDGSDFLLAFLRSGVYVQRIGAGGTLIDVEPRLIATPAIEPDTVHAVWDGTRYWLALSRWDGRSAAVALDRDGSVAGDLVSFEGSVIDFEPVGGRPVALVRQSSSLRVVTIEPWGATVHDLPAQPNQSEGQLVDIGGEWRALVAEASSTGSHTHTILSTPPGPPSKADIVLVGSDSRQVLFAIDGSFLAPRAAAASGGRILVTWVGPAGVQGRVVGAEGVLPVSLPQWLTVSEVLAVENGWMIYGILGGAEKQLVFIQVGSDGSWRETGAAGLGQGWWTRAIARGASGFLVAITTGGALEARLVDAAMNEIAQVEPVGVLPAPQWNASSAFNGEVHLVTWIETTSDGPLVRGARFTPNGSLLDPSSIGIGGMAARVRPVWDGKAFVVVISGPNGIHARRVSPEGTVLDADPIAIDSRYEWAFGVASRGEGETVIVHRGSERIGGVFPLQAVLLRDGVVARRVVFDPGTDMACARAIEIAWNGEEYLVVSAPGDACWPSGPNRVKLAGARLDETAAPLGAPVSLLEHAAIDDPVHLFGEASSWTLWATVGRDPAVFRWRRNLSRVLFSTGLPRPLFLTRNGDGWRMLTDSALFDLDANLEPVAVRPAPEHRRAALVGADLVAAIEGAHWHQRLGLFRPAPIPETDVSATLVSISGPPAATATIALENRSSVPVSVHVLPTAWIGHPVLDPVLLEPEEERTIDVPIPFDLGTLWFIPDGVDPNPADNVIRLESRRRTVGR